jgi:glycosyltransferase involved in cell wall biosynthesis
MRASNSILCILTGIFEASGGLEAFNNDLLHAAAQSLRDRKWTVLLLNDGQSSVADFEPNVRFHPCAVTKHRSLWKLKLAWHCLMHILIRRPALIVCGHINFAPLCSFCHRVFGIEYAILAYGIEVWHVESRITRRAIADAVIVVCISRYTAQKVLEQVPGAQGKTVILPCTVDTDSFSPGIPAPGLAERYGLARGPIILTVGRICAAEDYKGHKVMLEALVKVLKVKPETKYLIVGTGDLVPELKAKAKELGIEGSVVFAGFVPAPGLVDHYRMCDVFAMPSKGEGFGIVFLEALACGRPVIAGNRDGSRDALLDGELGFLVDPDSPEAVAAALLDVLDESVPGPRKNSDYLRHKTIEEFGKERFRERTGNVLSGILEAAHAAQ